MPAWIPAFGAWPEEGGVRFRVWAEGPRVELVVARDGRDEVRTLPALGDGTFGAWFADVHPGTRYRYCVDGRGPFPDPASRFQPGGVHGASMVVDPTFAWTDAAWSGIRRTDQVIYEAHVGTFTAEGTFDAMRARLPALVDLGVTVLELMPVADFAGDRNWGYDGVSLFAPSRAYGTPDALRRLVDEAHRLGLGVFLDVVYNHLGPDGAYAGALAPRFFSATHASPWGRAVNLDGDGAAFVRALLVENALYWIHEFHVDGLRLDATHALVDESPRHLLAELAERVRASAAPRSVVLVAEDDRNLRRLVVPASQGGYGLDAVWADDFHHELRRLGAGDSEGYFGNYAGRTTDVAEILTKGWLYTGQPLPSTGSSRGTPADGVSAEQFVVCLQNHDQVGNRATGERLHHQVDAATWRAMSTLLLTAPQTPLLFMGQEWASTSPFLYFTDHAEPLATAIREGRRREFAAFSAFARADARESIPDPQAAATFHASVLDWAERDREPHASVLRLYRALLALRRTHPAFAQRDGRAVAARATGEDAVVVELRAATGERARVVVRLRGAGEIPIGEGAAGEWVTTFSTEDPSFAPDGTPLTVTARGDGTLSMTFARPGAVVLTSNAPRATRPRRVPVSTYRLQLNSAFTFRDAAAVLPYLERLGVTDLYTSPYLKAAPGSLHGYDVADPSRINPEIGDDADYDALVAGLHARGMGHVLDLVPNHMGIDPQANPWWRDVLENGPSSPWADAFDIDWAPVKGELRGKVLLPILGDQYGVVLERGELRLAFDAGALTLQYFHRRLPLNPRQSPRIFQPGLSAFRERLGDRDPHVRELLSILTALTNLPPYTERSPEAIEERQREKEVARERFARLVGESPDVRAFVEASIHAANGVPGDAGSFDLLHDLLEAQAFRLAYWRTAVDEINYRRFFDTNDLAGVRMEDDRIFDAAHALVAGLVGRGAISGLRIDHPDGLFDPQRYLERLQRTMSSGQDPRPLWIVVEKILSAREALPEAWPVHGTTGYDFLNDVNGLFVDPASRRPFERMYARFTGRDRALADEIAECKRIIMRGSMASELSVLAHALNVVSEQDRRTRDFTLDAIRRALMEVVAAFPVYRTYVREHGATAADRAIVDAAIDLARRRNPLLEESLFRFLRDALLGHAVATGGGSPVVGDRLLAFARKFQQYTGPVQAKGLEDTLLYRRVVLLSLNEVGAEPERFGTNVDDFHRRTRERAVRWPYALLTTATHDTKRGEDARARISALSEIPDLWRDAVVSWRRVNAPHRTIVSGAPAPDRNDEYFFYQALVGAWPAEPADAAIPDRAPEELVARVQAYMKKATKEAKRHTSWLNEDEAYERALRAFVDRTLAGPGSRRFLGGFVPFVRSVSRLGVVNALAQVALRAAAPGVADTYQGTELWDQSFVDPDNRRPVAFGPRADALERMRPLLERVESGQGDVCAQVAAWLADWPSGLVKLWTLACALRTRRRFAATFLDGDYVPLATDADGALHLVAFARVHDGPPIVSVTPRLVSRLVPPGRAFPVGAMAWKTMRVFLPGTLPAASWRNVFTGERVSVVSAEDRRFLLAGRLFETLPVAWLVPDERAG